MADLRSPRLLYLKGLLFLVLGCMSATLLLIEHPSVKVALLLGLAVWAFARAYYCPSSGI
jgi:positive regulator of sigma E activity